MSKLPAFQFYPADWRADIGIQSLSFHDRGVWFEILCLMHQSEERGRLVLNGRPMSDEALSRALGLPVDELTATLERLLDYGVATRDDDGALVNRRMLRDEAVRRMRAEAGRRGGQKETVNIDNIEEEADDEQSDESVACNGEANTQANFKQTIKQNASKLQPNHQAKPTPFIFIFIFIFKFKLSLLFGERGALSRTRAAASRYANTRTLHRR